MESSHSNLDAPAQSARADHSSSSHPSLSALEWITLLHVGILVLATTWAFGGQADFVRAPLRAWASLSVLITLAALGQRRSWTPEFRHTLWWLLPLAGFNFFVLLATLNPSLREVQIEGETLLAHVGGNPNLPSSARPAQAWNALWLFDAIWLSAFNLALVVRHRRGLRGLLLILAVSALVLAVFGTVQKLAHAKGIFFDAFPTRQPRFFASFVYHNHWGAFMVMVMAAGIGLAWHYSRRIEARNIWHSPLLAGVVTILLAAATVPLSGSRSCTLLALLLFGCASLHVAWRVVSRARRSRTPVAPALSGLVLVWLLALSGVWFVGRDTIVARLEKSREQIAEMREMGGIGDRALLYRNTWRMARDKIWFGWGMSSYPHVFYRLYNTRESKIDRLPVFYNDAHNDWLQSLAEHGAVGTVLLALCAVVPLWHVRRKCFAGPLSTYLLTGCGLVLLYAGIEFPFGNLAVVLVWWVHFFVAVQLTRLRPIDRDHVSRNSA
jgi:O-antigen ligase